MPKLVFVTGASGFVASHIIEQVAAQGHRIRGTARSKKTAALRDSYASLPNVEIVEVNDIAHDQFPDAFNDVDVVIHTASPLTGRGSFDELVTSAVEGSLNVLRQAEKAGVKKFVITSSVGTLAGELGPEGVVLNADTWKPLTKEQATPPSGSDGKSNILSYIYSKISAERAVWEWADLHPDVDVTTIHPPFIYGPFTPHSLLPTPGDFRALSTSLIIYNFLNPQGTLMPEPGYADVRDVAKAHVGAAVGPTSADTVSIQSRKRIAIASPYGLDIKSLLELLKHKRAKEVEGRLYAQPVPQFPFDKYVVDYARLEEATGLKKAEFHSIEETVLDTLDSLLDVEKRWKEAGYIVDKVPPQDM